MTPIPRHHVEAGRLAQIHNERVEVILSRDEAEADGADPSAMQRRIVALDLEIEECAARLNDTTKEPR